MSLKAMNSQRVQEIRAKERKANEAEITHSVVLTRLLG